MVKQVSNHFSRFLCLGLATVQLLYTQALLIPNEHVLIVGNNGPNKTASITIQRHLYSRSEPQVYAFSNHTISPACGSHRSRCRNLVIANDSLAELTVLVPLNTTIGVMKFSYHQNNFVQTAVHVIEFPGQVSPCIPLTIFKHQRGFYTLCFIQNTNILYSCEIRVPQLFTQCHSQSISDASGGIDPALISNLEFIPAAGGDGHYAFTYGTKLHQVYPNNLAFEQYQFGFERAVNGPCEYLTYDGSNLFIYCYEEPDNITTAVLYDVIDGNWRCRSPEEIITYTCGTRNAHVTVFRNASYIRYSFQKTTSCDGQTHLPNDIYVNITGANMYHAVCFGSETDPIFVYLDRVEGLLVVNITANEEQRIQLPEQVCTNYSQCELFLEQNEDYLIILNEDSLTVTVLDTRLEYTPIITNNGSTSLVALLPFVQHEIIETTTPIDQDQNSTTEEVDTETETTVDAFTTDGEHVTVQIILPIVMAIAVLLGAAAISFVIAFLLCRRWRQKLKINDPKSKPPDNRGATEEKVLETSLSKSMAPDSIPESSSHDNLLESRDHVVTASIESTRPTTLDEQVVSGTNPIINNNYKRFEEEVTPLPASSSPQDVPKSPKQVHLPQSNVNFPENVVSMPASVSNERKDTVVPGRETLHPSRFHPSDIRHQAKKVQKARKINADLMQDLEREDSSNGDLDMQ